MIGWVRNIIIVFVLLTLVYAVLSLISRWRARDRIKGDYAASDKAIPEDEFVATGLKRYQKSYRAKLIIGVYLIPLIVLCGLIYLAQM